MTETRIDMNDLLDALTNAGLPATLNISPWDVASIQIGRDEATGRNVLVIGDAVEFTDGRFIADIDKNLFILSRDADNSDDDNVSLSDMMDIPMIVARTAEWYGRLIARKTDADLPRMAATIVFYFKTEIPSVLEAACANVLRPSLLTSGQDEEHVSTLDFHGLIIVCANYFGIPWLAENLPNVFAGYGVGVDKADAEW